MFLELCVLFICALCFCAIVDYQRSKGLPPGPPSIPFIGNQLDIMYLWYKHRSWRIALLEYNKKYGDIGTVTQSGYIQFVVSFQSAVKKVLSSKETQARIVPGIMKYLYAGNEGVFFANGHTWTIHRQMSSKTLKTLGFGQMSMEATILDQALQLASRFKLQSIEAGKEGVEMHNAFGAPVINCIWDLIGGHTFEYDDPFLLKFLKLIDEVERTAMSSFMCLNAYPFLRYIIPEFSSYNSQKRAAKFGETYFKRILKEHRENFKKGCVRDLIDGLLNETEDNPSIKLADTDISDICLDILLAGVDTGSNTLSFGILYLILNPEVQKKVHQEIDCVLGRERLPTIDDMNRLPYTVATIHEIQRLACVVPIIPRAVVEDFEFNGYTLPKGSCIWVNLYAAHMDKDYWKDPENFRPERFLEDGRVISHEYMFTYGGGRRRCLGDNIGRMFMFIFLTVLLQKFIFRIPCNAKIPTTESPDAIVVRPHPFKAVIEEKQTTIL